VILLPEEAIVRILTVWRGEFKQRVVTSGMFAVTRRRLAESHARPEGPLTGDIRSEGISMVFVEEEKRAAVDKILQSQVFRNTDSL
jgi:hypothetical protein